KRTVLFFTGAQILPRLLEDANRRLRLGPRLPFSKKQAVALFLGPLALGDVAKDDHTTQNLTRLAAKRARVGARPNPVSPVHRTNKHLHIVHILATESPGGWHVMRLKGSDSVRPIELVSNVGSGKCCVQRATDHPLSGGIHVNEPSLGV